MAPPLGKWLYPKSERVVMWLISGGRVTFLWCESTSCHRRERGQLEYAHARGVDQALHHELDRTTRVPYHFHSFIMRSIAHINPVHLSPPTGIVTAHQVLHFTSRRSINPVHLSPPTGIWHNTSGFTCTSLVSTGWPCKYVCVCIHACQLLCNVCMHVSDHA